MMLILSAWQVTGQETVTSKIPRDERLKWFNDARFGMMITWGAYSQLGGVWKGVYEGGYSEWIKFRQIPNVEYDSVVREFNPVDFNAEEWIGIAKNAGMKYIVIMAKHHDGFALYDSKVSTYDITDMTRFGRDPLAELAAACQKAGIKFGVYYSVDRDWHHPDAACDDHYKQCNFWDYPQNKTPGAMERWHKNYFPYAAKQVEELVTRYPVDLVWFDGIGLMTRDEISQLETIVYTNRPYCLINSRISNFVGSKDGDYGSKGDNETPGGYQAGGWENPGTLGFSYGYSLHDSLMGPKQAIHNLIDIVSKGGNYLLNVGPDGKGVIIPEAAGILGNMGDWLNVYGSSIYGCDGIPVKPPENIRLTLKPHELFIHVLDWNMKQIRLENINGIIGNRLEKISQVYMLSDPLKRLLKYRITDGNLLIDLSSCPLLPDQINGYAEVIAVTDIPDHAAVQPPYPGWKYSGSMFILTTPDGADLKVSASEKDFPLLVRFDQGFFDFSQAMPGGEDIRFATAAGIPLHYQLEQWDPPAGSASFWVRIPEISGNSRQEISVFWGKPGAKSESNGHEVFNDSNGYRAVLHMDDRLADETGNLVAVNAGSTGIAGQVGQARHFKEGQGISFGENINSFPTGSEPSTTEAWIRGDVPNGLVLGWGNEEKTGKVTMTFAGPPHIRMDCYWSAANVNSNSRLEISEWYHVVHTYKEGDSRIYINGVPDGFSSAVKNPLAIKKPVGMWIGGWKNDYWFTGDVDEVRVSNVARSADWVKLQYENQKPLQTLVGPIVAKGNDLKVSVPKIDIPEGESVKVTASAGGALKIYWIIKSGGTARTVQADRFTYSFDAGRVTANQTMVLQFKAVYADTVKAIDIPVTIRESIPEPAFSLRAPKEWNGRDQIRVIPDITNLSAMKARGADDLRYKWTVSGGAVITKEFNSMRVETDNYPSLRRNRKDYPEGLVIARSQYSGPILITLALDNGGQPTLASVPVMVKEPANDPWVERKPGRDEKPVDNQFIARNLQNVGTVYYNGKLAQPADSVFIRVTADGKPFATQVHKPMAGNAYAFAVKLKPGLIRYAMEFGTYTHGSVKVVDTVSNIVCGDAYIIDGQSNAEANDYGKAVNPYTSDFLRSFGCADTDPEKCRLNLWGNAVSYDNQGAKLQVGYWAIELGKQLIAKHQVPVCLINGAVGGSRIDVHQRNGADPTDSTTIYGRLLWRVRVAGLAYGIRGAFWHQGENDQGAAGPTGRFGWQDYQQYFIDMSGAWKQDYPNLLHYYIFQIWPRSCAMTENGSDNMLREVQRTLPHLFSNMGIMSTLGIKPPGGCHFPPEGYAEIAHLICPLVERDNYGTVFDHSITPPDLKNARYTGSGHDEIALEFDQPVVWNDNLASQFYLDGISGKIGSGSVTGNVIRLKLTEPGKALKISYLDSKTWSQDNLLWGKNGIAALTFYDINIEN